MEDWGEFSSWLIQETVIVKDHSEVIENVLDYAEIRELILKDIRSLHSMEIYRKRVKTAESILVGV